MFRVARFNNYPRSGTELAGTELHGTPVNQVTKPGPPSNHELEGFDSRTYIEDDQNDPTIYVDKSNPEVDLPDARGLPSHTHDLSQEGTRPVSRSFWFCERL